MSPLAAGNGDFFPREKHEQDLSTQARRLQAHAQSRQEEAAEGRQAQLGPRTRAGVTVVDVKVQLLYNRCIAAKDSNMSVDTVNIALSKVRRDVLNYPENFSESGYRKVLACLECMRDSLMKGHIDDFDRYVDGLLSREPDTADYILDDLFQQLGIQHRTQLSNILAQE